MTPDSSQGVRLKLPLLRERRRKLRILDDRPRQQAFDDSLQFLEVGHNGGQPCVLLAQRFDGWQAVQVLALQSARP